MACFIHLWLPFVWLWEYEVRTEAGEDVDVFNEHEYYASPHSGFLLAKQGYHL